MAPLIRKLLIFAAVDGLVLQPLAHRNQQAPPVLNIEYKAHNIAPRKQNHVENDRSTESLEVHGIVGLLIVSSAAFLISISQKQQVAQIRGKPIYAITDVALIPLSSQSEASQAIAQANEALRQQSKDAIENKKSRGDSSDDDEGDDRSVIAEDDLRDGDMTLPTTPEPTGSDANEGTRVSGDQRQSSVAEDVIGRKGQYGRFAERWFSKRGWSVERRRMQGMSADEIKGANPPGGDVQDKSTSDSAEAGNVLQASDPNRAEGESTVKEKEAESAAGNGDLNNDGNVTISLLPKLLRTTRILFRNNNFFFSYEYDITRSIVTQRGDSTSVPLRKIVDPLYFWNQNLALPFIKARQDSFVLPLMQGFVGQCSFVIQKAPKDIPDKIIKVHQEVGDVIEDQNNPDSLTTTQDVEEKTNDKNYLLTLISRRSIERAGLRYLRRGVDHEGNAANSVETEQILSGAAWDPSNKIYSFLQIRGSIPLYFSQSPYAFKPVPELHHSSETNYDAFKKHFTNVATRYGKVQVASLIERGGNELKIGEEFEKQMGKLNDNGGSNGSSIGFEWFDFHDACRGMKFENVSLLVDKLGDTITRFGCTVQQEGKIQSRQSGILRTNCMDCLDRTNVAQSAFSRKALDLQLMDQGFDLNLQSAQSTQWFNTIWADNGDAISKQYSSTAALKGDYTRTRKRDYRGALNDFGLTLSRYFNNIVNDYFSQAVIDYLLGNVNMQVFEEFEANMMSADPAISMDKVRQNAIDTSTKIVVADQSEDLIGGWTLLSPHSENTLRSFPFIENILLLTEGALYVVRFDWHTEKVSSFERVALHHVLGLQVGTYITSTLATAHTDPKRNVGFVVKYKPSKEDVVRVNTRSLKSDIVGGADGEDGKTVAGDDSQFSAPSAAAASLISNLTSAPWPRDSQQQRGRGSRKEATATRILAFKALPAQSSLATQGEGDDNMPDTGNGKSRNSTARANMRRAGPPNELATIKGICEEIERAATAGDSITSVRHKTEGEFEQEPQQEHEHRSRSLIEEKDLISLSEARKSTGLLEQLGYELKKLVWA
ncbi:MAG: hypothetical protein M1837_005388 [Sclerophora amabilis]|nr:MAG: hypothetical protein M1837_005388 [Sclerophora amabilis]